MKSEAVAADTKPRPRSQCHRQLEKKKEREVSSKSPNHDTRPEAMPASGARGAPLFDHSFWSSMEKITRFDPFDHGWVATQGSAKRSTTSNRRDFRPTGGPMRDEGAPELVAVRCKQALLEFPSGMLDFPFVVGCFNEKGPKP